MLLGSAGAEGIAGCLQGTRHHHAFGRRAALQRTRGSQRDTARLWESVRNDLDLPLKGTRRPGGFAAARIAGPDFQGAPTAQTTGGWYAPVGISGRRRAVRP